MGITFIKTSVVYFLIGVVLGLYMGITNQFQFISAHAHISLLGWVSSAIAGILYVQIPSLGSNKLAQAHFWSYLVGVPILVLAMFFFGLGMHGLGVPFSAIGGTLVVASVLLFALNVLFNLKSSTQISK